MFTTSKERRSACLNALGAVHLLLLVPELHGLYFDIADADASASQAWAAYCVQS